MSVIIFILIVLGFALGREWLQVKQTGWDRLSRKFRSQAPFRGRCRPCWWAQFTVPRFKFKTVANVGRISRWSIRVEFPPFWIGAATEGLYLKRNVWNVLHSPLLIPWNRIESVNQITSLDLIRNSPSSAFAAESVAVPPIIAVNGVGGPLVQLKLEPKLADASPSIVMQLAAFEQARPFLGPKLRLLPSRNA